MNATALIAEDEPLLAQALQAELARAWPELQILAVAGDGGSAVARALELLPRVLFLDIRIPGLTGIEVASEVADGWPEVTPLPAFVFVTAHDEYAVQAFEAQAVDYLLKPVQPDRLRKTVARLQDILRRQHLPPDEATLARLRQLLAAAQTESAQPRLRLIQAGVGSTLHMVPIDEVLCFEAADKYVRVLTRDREYLLRTPLRDLLPQLDPQVFWQVHRGTVVRATEIESVARDDAGRLHLALRGVTDKFPVSRLHAHLFKAM